MRLRALVCFTYVPCRSPEELFASSPCQNPTGLGLPLVHRKGYFQRTAPGKLFLLTFVWGRGIASLLLVSLKKVINCNDLPLLRPTMHLTRPLKVLRYMTRSLLQLFRERLSEKVHATISKGIVGGFEFAVLQRNLKEWYERARERPWTYVCAC